MLHQCDFVRREGEGERERERRKGGSNALCFACKCTHAHTIAHTSLIPGTSYLLAYLILFYYSEEALAVNQHHDAIS